MTERAAQLYKQHLEVVQDRYARALSASEYESVAIHAGALHMIFLDDMPYPFKVNPHFKSWLPVLDNPHCFVVFTAGSRPRLVFYQPVDYWHKVPDAPSGFWVDSFDVVMISTPQEAASHMPKARCAYIGEPDSLFESWNFAAVNPPALLEHLNYDRAWKTDYEIECMREANLLGARAHVAAEKAWRNGASEYEIHLEFMRVTGHVEHQLPYGNIIAFNENAAVLHYQHQERISPKDRHSFLIDAGAQYHGYASDITRTYTHATEFQDLIDAVETFQQEICSEVRPGTDYRTLHLSAHRHVADVLSKFDLIKASADEILEKKITSYFFPHGLGHYIGLQVHDVGGFSADRDGAVIPKPDGHPFLRLTRMIEPRQSFTIEPGLYFIESLLAELKASAHSMLVDWQNVDAMRKFGGIRIEDDLVVTETGNINLTREAFASLS